MTTYVVAFEGRPGSVSKAVVVAESRQHARDLVGEFFRRPQPDAGTTAPINVKVVDVQPFGGM